MMRQMFSWKPADHIWTSSKPYLNFNLPILNLTNRGISWKLPWSCFNDHSASVSASQCHTKKALRYKLGKNNTYCPSWLPVISVGNYKTRQWTRVRMKRETGQLLHRWMAHPRWKCNASYPSLVWSAGNSPQVNEWSESSTLRLIGITGAEISRDVPMTEIAKTRVSCSRRVEMQNWNSL